MESIINASELSSMDPFFIEEWTKLRDFLQCKLKPDIMQHYNYLTQKLSINVPKRGNGVTDREV